MFVEHTQVLLDQIFTKLDEHTQTLQLNNAATVLRHRLGRAFWACLAVPQLRFRSQAVWIANKRQNKTWEATWWVLQRDKRIFLDSWGGTCMLCRTTCYQFAANLIIDYSVFYTTGHPQKAHHKRARRRYFPTCYCGVRRTQYHYHAFILGAFTVVGPNCGPFPLYVNINT